MTTNYTHSNQFLAQSGLKHKIIILYPIEDTKIMILVERGPKLFVFLYLLIWSFSNLKHNILQA